MSRCRKISTDISVEAKLNRVSLLAALLYSWGIPHARDDCRLPKKDPEELRLMMIPGRQHTAEEVAAALGELVHAQLLGIDDDGLYFFPAEIFYKYQSYVGVKNRRETPPLNVRKTAENSGNNFFPHIIDAAQTKKLNEIAAPAENSGNVRKTAEMCASPSPSLSLSREFASAHSLRARESMPMSIVKDLRIGEDVAKQLREREEVSKAKELLAELIIPLAQRKTMPAPNLDERRAMLRRQAAQLRGGP